MTTEILGFIIIIGAVLVFAARRHIQKAEDDPEVLEASTGRLRYELEQSADEIISRMTEHIDRLERLLREADYKAELLQNKLDELQVAQFGTQPAQPANPAQPVQQTAYEQAQAMPDEAAVQQYEPGFDQLLQEQLQAKGSFEQSGATQAEYSADYDEAQTAKSTREWIAPEASVEMLLGNEAELPQAAEQELQSQLTDTQLKALQYLREASMQLEAEYEAQTDQGQLGSSISQSAASSGPQAYGETVAYNIYEVAEPSVADENVTSVAQKSEAGYVSEVIPEVHEIPASVQSNNDQIEASTAKARELLAMGYGVEDIARTTGLGIGAVQLMRQMQQR